MTTVQIILLIIGVTGLLKSVWGIAHPASFRRFAGAAVKIIGYVPNFYGFAVATIGVIFWIVILVGLPVSNWALAAFGLLFVLVGMSAVQRGGIGFLANPLVTRQNLLVIRILSLISIIISAVVIWIAVARWS